MSAKDLAINTKEGLVSTGKNGQITAYRILNFQYTTLAMLILYRLLNNRDMKILITSSGSTTGTGKTTLAIHLCRWIRQASNEIFNDSITWNAEDYSFVELRPYFEAYKESESGEALLMDEIEYSADKRRSMSHENLAISQAWSILRYRNVVSVATMPSTEQLDKRLLTLADVWINVVFPGRANTYYLTTDDFAMFRGSSGIVPKRLKQNGYRESLVWPKIQESDPDFSYLKGKKADLGIPGLDDRKTYSAKDVKNAKTQAKREMAIMLLEWKEQGLIDLTQAEIGEAVPFDGYSQQNIAKIKREEF